MTLVLLSCESRVGRTSCVESAADFMRSILKPSVWALSVPPVTLPPLHTYLAQYLCLCVRAAVVNPLHSLDVVCAEASPAADGRRRKHCRAIVVAEVVRACGDRTKDHKNGTEGGAMHW